MSDNYGTFTEQENTFKTFAKYDAFVKETAIFPDNIGVVYCTTKLNGEAGEVAEKFADLMSDRRNFIYDYTLRNSGFLNREAHGGLIKELGDCLWYVSALAQEVGSTIVRVMEQRPQNDVADEIFDASAVHNVIRLNANAGRIAEKVGKFIRDKKLGYTNDAFCGDPLLCSDIVSLLCEVVYNIDRISEALHSNLEEVIETNIAKLESRRARNVLSGSGDNR